jgi:hypothetical protein
MKLEKEKKKDTIDISLSCPSYTARRNCFFKTDSALSENPLHTHNHLHSVERYQTHTENTGKICCRACTGLRETLVSSRHVRRPSASSARHVITGPCPMLLLQQH